MMLCDVLVQHLTLKEAPGDHSDDLSASVANCYRFKFPGQTGISASQMPHFEFMTTVCLTLLFQLFLTPLVLGNTANTYLLVYKCVLQHVLHDK